MTESVRAIVSLCLLAFVACASHERKSFPIVDEEVVFRTGIDRTLPVTDDPEALVEELRMVRLVASDLADNVYRVELLVNGEVTEKTTVSCNPTNEAESCYKQEGDTIQVMTIGGLKGQNAICGCVPTANVTPGDAPTSLVVDWAISSSAQAISGQTMVDRLNAAPLGVSFSTGSSRGRLPDVGYGCALGYLRFLQRVSGERGLLLGIAGEANCTENKGRAAQIPACCEHCAVAVFESACVDDRYVIEHEVAHLLGADHTNDVNHYGHSSQCSSEMDLMHSDVQLCPGDDCSADGIVVCDVTAEELREGPRRFGRKTCPEGIS